MSKSRFLIPLVLMLFFISVSTVDVRAATATSHANIGFDRTYVPSTKPPVIEDGQQVVPPAVKPPVQRLPQTGTTSVWQLQVLGSLLITGYFVARKKGRFYYEG